MVSYCFYVINNYIYCCFLSRWTPVTTSPYRLLPSQLNSFLIGNKRNFFWISVMRREEVSPTFFPHPIYPSRSFSPTSLLPSIPLRFLNLTLSQIHWRVSAYIQVKIQLSGSFSHKHISCKVNAQTRMVAKDVGTPELPQSEQQQWSLEPGSTSWKYIYFAQLRNCSFSLIDTFQQLCLFWKCHSTLNLLLFANFSPHIKHAGNQASLANEYVHAELNSIFLWLFFFFYLSKGSLPGAGLCKSCLATCRKRRSTAT